MPNDRTLPLIGRCFYAVALIGSGIQQVITSQFVRLIPRPPSAERTPWPAVIGVILIVLGAMILLRWRARLAGMVTAALLLVLLVFLHVPIILKAPLTGYMWTNPSKVLALAAGALVVSWALQPPPVSGDSSAEARKMRRVVNFGRLALGLFLTICGVQHFVYADFVATLVPAWIGNLRFWTYFTGTALVAGGVGLLLPRMARWAALLSGVMVFLWVILLHIPRAVAGPDHRGEMGGVFEALAISGVALALAAHARARERAEAR